MAGNKEGNGKPERLTSSENEIRARIYWEQAKPKWDRMEKLLDRVSRINLSMPPAFGATAFAMEFNKYEKAINQFIAMWKDLRSLVDQTMFAIRLAQIETKTSEETDEDGDEDEDAE